MPKHEPQSLYLSIDDLEWMWNNAYLTGKHYGDKIGPPTLRLRFNEDLESLVTKDLINRGIEPQMPDDKDHVFRELVNSRIESFYESDEV